MGGSNSKNVENIINVTSESILNAATKVSNECNLQSNNIQDLTIKVDNADLLKTCIENSLTNGRSPTECEFLKISGVNFENINQTYAATIVGECNFSSAVESELQNEIANQIEQKMSKETDAFGEAMVDMVNSLNNTEANTINKQDIHTAITNNISVDFINEMITDIKGSQKMYFEIGGLVDDLSFQNINQNLVIEAFMKMATTNKNFVKAATSVTTDAAQELKNQQKGITDAIESITSMFSNPWFIIGCIVLLCAMMVGGFIFMDAKKGGVNFNNNY
jgi:hypothetical protein